MKNLSTSLFFSLIFVLSCSNDDEAVMMEPTGPDPRCENVDCASGGTCVDGICACDPGYVGERCETYVPVQLRLQSETPIEIIDGGISIDSLYGKLYAGGIIFYIDMGGYLPGKEGLVCSPNFLPRSYGWGCLETDLDNVPNVAQYPNRPFSNEAGAKIGDGLANTQAISARTCASQSAATACTDASINGFDDWFLPAAGTLDLMYKNLEVAGLVDFNNQTLWSSTERAGSGAWRTSFSGGAHAVTNKQSNLSVRPVRTF
ncbi:MAG: hypothetical protein AAF741_11425 [Bacteroidota bacterium]